MHKFRYWTRHILTLKNSGFKKSRGLTALYAWVSFCIIILGIPLIEVRTLRGYGEQQNIIQNCIGTHDRSPAGGDMHERADGKYRISTFGAIVAVRTSCNVIQIAMNRMNRVATWSAICAPTPGAKLNGRFQLLLSMHRWPVEKATIFFARGAK